MKVIGGQFKTQKIYSLKTIRPTTAALKEALFNICRKQIKNALFLDIFAGSGAVGIEALSRGAQYVVFIEKTKKGCQVINKNLEKLKLKNFSKIICKDMFLALEHLNQKFDIIYIDPPYEYFQR